MPAGGFADLHSAARAGWSGTTATTRGARRWTSPRGTRLDDLAYGRARRRVARPGRARADVVLQELRRAPGHADLLARPLPARAAARWLGWRRPRASLCAHRRRSARLGSEPSSPCCRSGTNRSLGLMALREAALRCGPVRAGGRVRATSFCHHDLQASLGGVGTANGRSAATRSGSRRPEAAAHPTTREGPQARLLPVCVSKPFGGGWPEAEFASVRLPAIDTPSMGRPSTTSSRRSVAPLGRRLHGRRPRADED